MKINVNILLIDEYNNLSDYETITGYNKEQLITKYTEIFQNLLQSSFSHNYMKHISVDIQD